MAAEPARVEALDEDDGDDALWWLKSRNGGRGPWCRWLGCRWTGEGRIGPGDEGGVELMAEEGRVMGEVCEGAERES